MFKKHLQVTKKKLENIKPKILTLEKKNEILYKINRELSNKLDCKYKCGICFDVLSKNISTGECGHCFHTKCLEFVGDTCPMCRCKTKFIKLFL